MLDALGDVRKICKGGQGHGAQFCQHSAFNCADGCRCGVAVKGICKAGVRLWGEIVGERLLLCDEEAMALCGAAES